MERELLEEKRAENLVWGAAGSYSFEPMYLAFEPDGSASLYLNLVIGLVYKWLEPEKIRSLLASISPEDEELLAGIVWLGLEQAVYRKECRVRPVLAELRRDYAKENLERAHRFAELPLIEKLRMGRCLEILQEEKPEGGLQEPGWKVGAWEQKLLKEISCREDETTDEIVEQMQQIWKQWFGWCPGRQRRVRPHLLQKVLPAFRSFGRVHSSFVRADGREERDGKKNTQSERTGKKGLLLFQASHYDREEAARQYIEACFGRSLYVPAEQKKIERQLCTGNHEGLHLLFTRGISGSFPQYAERTGAVREIREFLRETQRQQEKNLLYYRSNAALYGNSIRRLKEKLMNCLEEQIPDRKEGARGGRLLAAKVWKGVYQNDSRVFVKTEGKQGSRFSVHLLLDASSSRKGSQEQVAAQGYILAESLSGCGIPVQVCSYCSMMGYTVLRIFRGYREQQKNQEIFRYAAAGSNRDGLALRAAGYLMQEAPEEKKLLIVLTDASPNDDRIAREGPFYRNREYLGEVGIRDTAGEVRALRNRGICVLGVFMGAENDVEAAREIFGREFVVIRRISEFADAVGNLLKEQLQNG